MLDIRPNSLFPVLLPGLPGPPWRLVPSPEADLLAVEIRDPETRAVSFYVHRFLSGDWIPITQTYDWWKTIWCCHGPYLVLHGYAAPDWPVKQGLEVWDTTSSTLIWHAPRLFPLDHASEALWVRKETGEVEVLELRTGAAQAFRQMPLPQETPPLSPTESEAWIDTGGRHQPWSVFRIGSWLALSGQDTSGGTLLSLWLRGELVFQEKILPSEPGFEPVLLAGRQLVFSTLTGELAAVALNQLETV